MSEAGRVNDWFLSGRLLPPLIDGPNTVSLVRALASLGGAELAALGGAEIKIDEVARALAALIGRADHYVFVLADGLGMKILERLPADAFLRKHTRLEIRAVFPSTTATAITTIATAEWPARHGSAGWWMYIAEADRSIVTLPFVDRYTAEKLGEAGLSPGGILAAESVWPRLTHSYRAVHPANLVGSAYSDYFTGGIGSDSYKEFPDALAAIPDRIASAPGPTFTYVYLPQIDDACHVTGFDSDRTLETLERVNAAVERLHTELRGRAKLVLTADHGHRNVEKQDRIELEEGDALLEPLVCPPTGDPRVPIFHVKPGREDEFADAFRARCGGQFALLTPDEAEALKLYGPNPIGEVLRKRLGSFIGIAGEPWILYHVAPGKEPTEHIGFHAGMSPEEMRVPLALA